MLLNYENPLVCVVQTNKLAVADPPIVSGDIIMLYNKFYLPLMKDYLLKVTPGVRLHKQFICLKTRLFGCCL